jgi:hypothetical protein
VSDASASAGVGSISKRTALVDEWVTRVLGYQFAPAGRGEAAARFEAARPKEAPNTAMTANLLATMARAAPEAAEELPAILSGMIPRFLLAIQNEPHMDAQPMVQDAVVPAQDQVLAVADSLNAVLSSARRWEALLDQAEQADATIDKMEEAERDAAQQKEYEELVPSYNTTRLAALAEEARCMQLVDTLATEFRAAQGAAAR